MISKQFGALPKRVWRRAMTRRLFVIVLTLASISTAVLGWASYVAPTRLMLPVTARLSGYVYFADGLVRFYWYHGSADIRLEPSQNFRRVVVRRVHDGALWWDVRHAALGRIRPNAIFSNDIPAPFRIGRDRLRMVGVRFRVAWLVAALIAYPFVLLLRIRVSRHAHRPGHCIYCRYDLRGSVSGICPECGRKSLCIGCGCDLVQVTGVVCPECGLEISSMLNSQESP